jgi:hypothetical protein
MDLHFRGKKLLVVKGLDGLGGFPGAHLDGGFGGRGADYCEAEANGE